MALRVEFTVEPFVRGDPGPHVLAAVDAARDRGFAVDFGPFGTSVTADDTAILDALPAIVRAAVDAGASRVSIQVERSEP